MQVATEFDFEKFWGHVEQYVKRWNLHLQDLADMSGLSVKELRYNYKYKRPLSLRSVCKLAALCDLDLNTYNKATTSL